MTPSAWWASDALRGVTSPVLSRQSREWMWSWGEAVNAHHRPCQVKPRSGQPFKLLGRKRHYQVNSGIPSVRGYVCLLR